MNPETQERRLCAHPDCCKDAEYEIYDNNERDPYYSLPSCAEHVGSMLYGEPPQDPPGPWTIRRILK
jgi:hypothetical protein